MLKAIASIKTAANENNGVVPSVTKGRKLLFVHKNIYFNEKIYVTISKELE